MTKKKQKIKIKNLNIDECTYNTAKEIYSEITFYWTAGHQRQYFAKNNIVWILAITKNRLKFILMAEQ